LFSSTNPWLGAVCLTPAVTITGFQPANKARACADGLAALAAAGFEIG
jgi:hypothetical protein